MDKKKKILISILITFLILIGVFAGFYFATKNNRKDKTSQTDTHNERTLDTLSPVEKEIAGIDTTDPEEDEKEFYSDLYKEYLKLPEEEKEKTEVVPRKQEVPFEKLEEIKEILEEDNKNENENNKNEEEDIIPEKFNLADKIDIKVGNQGSYGLCWDLI